MKYLTRSEAETKRQQAVEFLRRMGRDDDDDRFEAMDARGYAEHKGARLLENPSRRRMTMPRDAGPTKAEMGDTLDQIADLAEDALDPELTREEVVAKVKELADLASGEEPEEEEVLDDPGLDDENDQN